MDGNWSAWTPFSSCSNTCGDGIKSRHRTCSNPAPLHGGKFCSGTKTETMTCSDGPCPGLFFLNMTEILKTFFTLKKNRDPKKNSLYMYIHNYRIYDLSCESFDILVGYTFALFVPFTFYLNFNCFFCKFEMNNYTWMVNRYLPLICIHFILYNFITPFKQQNVCNMHKRHLFSNMFCKVSASTCLIIARDKQVYWAWVNQYLVNYSFRRLYGQQIMHQICHKL